MPANNSRYLKASATLASLMAAFAFEPVFAQAQDIGQLLQQPVDGQSQGGLPQGTLGRSVVPVPQPRPADLGNGVPMSFSPAASASPAKSAADNIAAAPAPVTQTASIASMARAPIAASTAPKATPINGSLKSGMDALYKNDISRARGIRYGLPAGSLDRKILAWSMAMSGRSGITSAEISQIAHDLPNWPGQDVMRRNAERAIFREKPPAQTVIKAFGNHKPESVEGAAALAEAYLATGNTKAANKALAPWWRKEKLSESEEKEIMQRAGRALSKNDHATRSSYMLYKERNRDGLRMAGYGEQTSLARAFVAVNRDASDADRLIGSVAASSRKNATYQFVRIKRYRRTGKYREAANLLLRAPRNRSQLVNPDEWWVERRIISRELIDMGDPKTAYKIAAEHAAESPKMYAEAEWHAGWYALRFLNNKHKAAAHFKNVTKSSDSPITQARGYYWLGRATGSRGYYSRAAKYPGTYYGQLAAAKLGKRSLKISNPRPSATDRAKFKSREPVRAIERLESIGYSSRASTLYLDLAEELNDPGELALLSARAEKRGNRALALQVGKIAYKRGLPVDTLAWPVGAIPSSARLGKSGTALAYAISRQESAFNVSAVSPANARGLMQLLPGTAKMMARKTGLGYNYKRLTRDGGYNATLGSAYLSQQLDKFDNSYILTFAGYNAGPGKSKDWMEQYGSPRGKSIEEVVDWVERIPYTETRNYVQRVMENYQVYKARLAGSKLDIVDDLRYGRR